MRQSEKYFELIRDSGGRQSIIYKKSKPGKVLTHLLENLGKITSLEEIEGISQWKEPRKEMGNLTKRINRWSHYEIEIIREDGDVFYRMIRKE